ncbi:MAG: Ig-like domain-containing protein [Gemmatimonadales bacterium]
MIVWKGIVLGGATLALVASAAAAQTPARIEVSPASLKLQVGDTAQLSAKAYDESGKLIDAPLMFFSSSRRRLDVDRQTGQAVAVRGGSYTVRVFSLTARGVEASVDVEVAYPPLARIDLAPTGDRFFVGAAVRHTAKAYDAVDDYRRDATIRWTTDNPSIASVNRFGVLEAHRPGSVTLSATAEGVTAKHAYRVVANPIASVKLTASADSGRTGDVFHFSAEALDADGRRVADAPITYTLVANPEDTVVAQIPAAEIDQQGRFVAGKAGSYTILAVAPGRTAQQTVTISNRHVSQQIEFVGQAAVRDVHTSDLWVWEGTDGRDYAVTGTHSAQGATYFWDVTDPSSPVLTDSLVVDARTTNDVKVSEDGRIAVISREGASNRRNGIVILDVSNPRAVKVLSRYDDELTGGVHNLFIYKQHVYAVNNGRRFDVINIEDPTKPHRVARFELDTPGHGIHDIWIVDGVAYTSNWGDGVVVIDVGNGKWGGSPSNPVEVTRFRDVGGATHAAFPYRSPTGKFYIFMGDEIGRQVPGGGENRPQAMSGYVHIVDFTDPEHPEEVARYEVPEAGSHNMWIENDVLYAAFYNGGMRVVDISGELKGNLFYQNREIARYMAYDPGGKVANAPFTWGGQPHKGNLFFAEYNSGLWAAKLKPRLVLTP